MKKLIVGCWFILFSFASFSQSNIWTWMKGDSTWEPGVYGTAGIPAPANKPGGRSGAAFWMDTAGKFWVLGGGGFSTSLVFGALNDLWKYDPATNMWVLMKGDSVIYKPGIYGTKGIPSPTNKPGGRYWGGHWRDSEGKFWIFGGQAVQASPSSSTSSVNELWKYDPATNMWTWVRGGHTEGNTTVYGSLGVSSPANRPSRRQAMHSWTDTSGNLWLFGGSDNSNSMNDLWKFDPSNNQWVWIRGDSALNNPGNYGTKGVPAATNDPAARCCGSTWTDTAGNFWLYGGQRTPAGSLQFAYLNDLWKYDVTTNRWTWVNGDSTFSNPAVYGTKGIPSPSNTPGARAWGATWAEGSHLWLFGGGNQPPPLVPVHFFNDMWKFDMTTNQWTWVHGDTIPNTSGSYGTQGVPAVTNLPHSRHAGPATWKDTTGTFWMFGGSDYGFLNDVWKFSYFPCAVSDTGISYSGPSNFCGTASNILINGSLPSGLLAGFTYQWQQSADSINFTDINGATLQNYTASSITSTTYFKRIITSTCGVYQSNIVGIHITPAPPTPTISSSGPTTICQGGSVTLSSSATTNNQWYKDGVAISGATSQNFVANQTGSYTVQVSIGNCSATSSASNVVVNATPAPPSITASGSPTFCAGGSVELTTSSTANLQWNLNNIPIPGANAQNYVATTGGNYSVTASNGSCSTVSTAFVVTVNSLPGTPTITASGPLSFCQNGSVRLVSSSVSGNQWYQNGVIIAGATGQNYTAYTAGSYTVRVTVNGCTSLSSDITDVTIAGCILKSIEINPNPFGSIIQLKTIGYNERVRVLIFDAIGRLVKDESFNLTSPSLTNIATAFLVAGSYWIKVITSDVTVSKQLVKLD